MICPKCGSNNSDGTAFCASCGAPLSNEAPTPNGAVPNNNVPPQTPPPVFNGNPYGGPIEQRNIALCIILSIVTCGIYMWYWIYKLTEDVNKLTGDPNATSGGMVILLSIITCNVYMWYWLYKQGDAIDQVKASRGLPSGNSGILYLILAIFGWAFVTLERNVDFPTFGKPTSPTSAITFSSRRTSSSCAGWPGCANLGTCMVGVA